MSIVNKIKYLRKAGKARYIIEVLISKVEDLEEKRVFIKMYNDKLKRLGINEVYEAVPFESV